MIKEINQEESVKLSSKNMGCSYVLESHKLDYSFHFCSIPNRHLFQWGKNPSQIPAYEEASNFPVTEVLLLSNYTVPESYIDDNHVFFTTT